MKKIFIIIIAILLGYVLGNAFPFNFSNLSSESDSEKGIQGNTQLIITAKRADTGDPVSNLEIDFATQPGPPPVGGMALTDENGVAEFNVQPGDYFIYFNQNTFPENLKMPSPEKITVVEGITNKKELFLVLK
jgi:hypothetical protein